LELVEKNDSFDTEKRIEFAKELYQILITPIENKLDAGKQLCLIPDKILFRLSFAALISPDEEKYFVDRYKFFSAPSASIFLIDSEKAGRLRQNTAETLLSVGNPAFSRKDFAALSNLESSAREAEKIASFYNEAILLTGKDASKEKFRMNLSGANVIHFAGHYLPNENSPLLSSLILAENERTREPKDSVLANHEIIGAELSQAKLIVLSACQTGIERFYNGEGMTGAARTFLATGVPLVVASQWQVDSDATAELMIDFHRYRAIEKLSTVEALRRAQLDMMAGENKRFQNPYYWAGFTVLGGYAEF
jgi:CHAT domain-containing protein